MNGTMIKDFRQKVLEKKSDVTDKEFFLSKQCHAYMQNLSEAICKLYNNVIHVVLEWNDDGHVAYATDRYQLVLNLNNSFFHRAEGRINKLVIQKGLVLHECGHLLFTDFHLAKSTRETFLNKRELFPKPKCEEYNTLLADMKLWTEEELTQWFMLWKRLENSIEDGFIESKVLENIPGEGQCLYHLRKIQLDDFESVKVQKANGLSEPAILFNSILSMAKYGTVKMDADDKSIPAIATLLSNYDLIREAVHTDKSFIRIRLINEIFCKFYKFMKDELQNKANDASKSQDKNSSNDNNSEQENQNAPSGSDTSTADSVQNNDESAQADNKKQDNDTSQNDIKDDKSNTAPPTENEQNDTNQQSNSNQKNEKVANNTSLPGNSSSQPNSSSENTDDSKAGNTQSKPDPSSVLNNIPADIDDDIDSGSGSVLNDNNIKNNEPQSYPRNNTEKMDELMKEKNPEASIPSPQDMRLCDSIEEKIAEEKVMAEAENELIEALQKEVSEFDYSPINKNIKVNIVRDMPSPSAYDIYDKDMEEIRFLVKKTINEIRNKIKDHQQGGKINGLYQGRYLDQHSLYRYDLRTLCKNDLPEDIPNMAFSILVDASGSMAAGRKLDYARQTALLLYEFGLALNIPVMVYAHDVSNSVTMYSLADYGSVDGKDKYRICDLHAGGCNRDGMALRFCSEKLSQRKEETKIMFVISDGLPSDYNSTELAYQDIKNVLLDYSKKNVKYIAFGLGNDQDRIENIYTQGLSPKIAAHFVKTDEPGALPKEIVKTIKNLIKV